MSQPERRKLSDRLRQRTSLSLKDVKSGDVVIFTTENGGLYSFSVHTPAGEDKRQPGNFAVGTLRGQKVKQFGSDQMGALFLGLRDHEGKVIDSDVVMRNLRVVFELSNGENFTTDKVVRMSVNKR